MHHHAERHCRGLEVILACNQLIEREAHVARARVPVVLHDEARGGGRRHLPQVGARQPGLARVGLRVLPLVRVRVRVGFGLGLGLGLG